MSITMKPTKPQSGFSMIEVLVTMIIVVVGLLGVLGMQTKATTTEFESYQRGQALALAREMQNRLLNARGDVTQYVTGSNRSSTDGSVFMGTGSTAFAQGTDCKNLTDALRNLCDWSEMLKGSAAVENGRGVGAMTDARGCLIRVEPAEGNALADIYVAVVWRGVVQGSEPAANSPAGRCASAIDYGTGLRRGLSVRVLIPDLKKDSTAGGPIFTE